MSPKLPLVVEPLEGRVLLAASLVLDINAGAGSTTFFELVAASNGVFFRTPSGIWGSDGTAGGTHLVAQRGTYFDMGSLGSVGARGYYLTTTIATNSYIRLWQADGRSSAAVTKLPLSDLAPIAGIGGTLFIPIGRQLWVSDGTSAGTHLLRDFGSGAATTAPHNFIAFNGITIFTAAGGVWRTDGTTAGTQLLANTDLGEPVSIGNTLYFKSETDGFLPGTEIWRTDGTVAGTSMIQNIDSSVGDPGPQSLAAFNGKLYFTGQFVRGRERKLWESDGTEAGTRTVSDLSPDNLIAAGDSLFLLGQGALRKLDASGTITKLHDFSSIGSAIAIGNRLYFVADDGAHGSELWTSDGTVAGTVLFQDINAGLEGSNPSRLTAVGNALFFTADDGVHGEELWQSGVSSPATLEGGVLRVDGTVGADYINVTFDFDTGGIAVTLNATSASYSRATVSTIRVYAGGGNDFVNVNSSLARAYVDGGAGSDTITCDSGNDTLVGGDGDDSLSGGDGNDRIDGLAGNDTVTGGVGADTLYGGDGDDQIEGGDQADRIYGGAGNDRIAGGSGADRLYGEAGNDTVDGGTQNDLIDGGAGVDKLTGGEGNDNMIGGDGSDRMYGQEGNDTLDGGKGNDTLDAGAGRDKLLGGIGNDRLYALDKEKDTLDGGAGSDRADHDKLDVLLRVEL